MRAAKASSRAASRERTAPERRGLAAKERARDAGRLVALMLAVGIALIAWRPEPAVAAEKPLLIPGKSTLYQRVLTRPCAQLRSEPGPGGQLTSEVLPPFTHFFIYGRSDDGNWLRVGYGAEGSADGWLAADKAVAWDQTITLAFSQPIDRDRALFFSDRTALRNLIESEDLIGEAANLRRVLASGQMPTDFPVVSIEPETYVDLNKSFYLLPIIDFEQDIFFESGFSTTALQVAALRKGSGDRGCEGDAMVINQQQQPPLDSLRDYRSGVVFVIDTTTSMGPYITLTREAMQRIYRRIEDSRAAGRVGFGIVGFRDNIGPAPALEYVTQVFTDLPQGLQPSGFFDGISRVTAAQVSSKGFNEDAYAGVASALKDIRWDGFNGRFIVLITDAGPRASNDPLATTTWGAETLRLLAQEKQQPTAIYALHLKTPEGQRYGDHAYAEGEYRALTQWTNVGNLYFPVDAGSVIDFEQQIDALANEIVDQILQTAEGRLAGQNQPEADSLATGGSALAASSPPASTTEAIRHKTELVGRAMQLAYLGRVAGTEAPDIFEAWVADRDFTEPAQKVLDVRVLITKTQLSNLWETLGKIHQTAEQTRLTPEVFFEQLRAVAATLTREPEALSETQVRRLADVGLIGEYLEGLPYHSKVMEITRERWETMTFGQQREFLDELEEKMRLYRDWYGDADLWVSLQPSSRSGEVVYPIPIDALP